MAMVLVKHILESARKRLAVLSPDASLFDAARILPRAPVLGDDGRAQGVLHARDVAIALIDEVNYEDVLLRDYVMGVGYQ